MKVRLTKEQLNNIAKLTKDGKSLNQITNILAIKKTTVYYHFRKIKGRTVKPIFLQSEDEELIGEFIGLFAGDGCADKTEVYIYRTYLCFNITEKEFVKDLIENVLIKLFGKRPMIFRQENRLNLCYYSKNIHHLINKYLHWDKKIRKTYTVRLKEEEYSKKFIIGFLRGSLDSDGYFSKKKISFATVSHGLMLSIKRSLDGLGIKHSVRLYKEKRANRKDIYHINIMKLHHEKFIELVKPRNIKDRMRRPGFEFLNARS